MKARIPKSWNELPRSERERLTQYAKEIALQAAEEQLTREMRIMLDIYIKMVCVVLHDAFGFGESRLTQFLGNHRRLFVQQAKLVAREKQIEYLDGRMAEIFKNDGFPKQFFDNLLGEIETSTDEEKTDR